MMASAKPCCRARKKRASEASRDRTFAQKWSPRERCVRMNDSRKKVGAMPADEKTGEDIVETEASARGDAARNRRAISLSFGQPPGPARQHADASELMLGRCARGRDY